METKGSVFGCSGSEKGFDHEEMRWRGCWEAESPVLLGSLSVQRSVRLREAVVVAPVSLRFFRCVPRLQALPSARRERPAMSRSLEPAIFLGESNAADRWSALSPVHLLFSA